MAKTLLDKLRARTGVSHAAPANYLERVAVARKKLAGAGVAGVSKQVQSGQRPILSALGTIFPNVFGRFATQPKEEETEDTEKTEGDWGVYDWQSNQELVKDSMPEYPTKRPFRRMRSGI